MNNHTRIIAALTITGLGLSAAPAMSQPANEADCQGTPPPDDLKLTARHLEQLDAAIETFTYALRQDVDGYTAADDLWEWIVVVFGEDHAWRERSRFLATCTVHHVFQREYGYLFDWDGALDHIIWTEPEHI